MTVDDYTAELIRQDFDLPRGSMTEADLLHWLAQRVAELMVHRMEYLMSLCYTLDLSEEEVAIVLSPVAPAAPHEGLARLLYERQCRRAETKRSYPTTPLDDDDAW
ncbi:hypothetical protein GGR28_002606 [Lewinella aquimaris]|uniref:Uncharacterized protein n=1 Tax=Neolewinella aquimaris TaxID=1835722 RepID=A0A840EDV1_9BACT|nr:hypothetical protein [Neolewinella aquimaris]MBB4079979.1 hypothetical protein [Neolewinella aquimaris]